MRPLIFLDIDGVLNGHEWDDTAESAAKDVLRLVEIYRNALNTVDEAGPDPIADKVGALFDARPVGGGLSDGQ
jgi:hypothetical protein